MTANSVDEMNVPLQQPGSIKMSLLVHLEEKFLHLYTANVTSPTWQTEGKIRSRSHHAINQSIITRHKRGSDHYAHKSNISKAVNQSKSPQLTESHPTHWRNTSVSVFLFKCKLSNRFLTGTEPLAKAISLI